MFRVITTAVLLAASQAALFGQLQQGSTPSTEKLPPAATLASAQELAGKGRLDAAMTQLDQLSQQSPEPAGVERLRGLIYYQRESLRRRSTPSRRPPIRIPAITNRLKCME